MKDTEAEAQNTPAMDQFTAATDRIASYAVAFKGAYFSSHSLGGDRQ